MAEKTPIDENMKGKLIWLIQEYYGDNKEPHLVDRIIAKAKPYYIEKGRQMEKQSNINKVDSLVIYGGNDQSDRYNRVLADVIDALKGGKDV